MPFEQRWSREQRLAVVELVLDRGMSTTEALAAAQRGETEEPPFNMPVSTAHLYVRQERARRLDEKREAVISSLTREELREDLATTVLQMGAALALSGRQLVDAGVAAGVRPEEIRKWGRAYREIKPMLDALPHAEDPEQPEEEGPQLPPELLELARKAEARE